MKYLIKDNKLLSFDKNNLLNSQNYILWNSEKLNILYNNMWPAFWSYSLLKIILSLLFITFWPIVFGILLENIYFPNSGIWIYLVIIIMFIIAFFYYLLYKKYSLSKRLKNYIIIKKTYEKYDLNINKYSKKYWKYIAKKKY